jgi:hypothetical protein
MCLLLRSMSSLPEPAARRYMLASLKEAAIAAGHPEWGHGGPHDSGHYNSHSSETGFFRSYGGSWDTGAQCVRWAPVLLIMVLVCWQWQSVCHVGQGGWVCQESGAVGEQSLDC